MDSTISIIIPAYNNANEIEGTFQSILAGNGGNYEIIFVNDGSKDNTLQILNQIKRKYKDIAISIISQENQGVSSARNLGIYASKGKYLFFCDGDDVIMPEFFECVQSKIDVDADLIIWKHNVIKQGEELTLEFAYPTEGFNGYSLFLAMMQDQYRLCMGSFMIKRSVLETFGIRFRLGMRYGEDLEFICKSILHAERIEAVDTVLYTYIHRKGSAMHHYDIRRFDAPKMVLLLDAYIREHEELAIDTTTMNYLNTVYFIKQFTFSLRACLQYLVVGQYKDFWRCLDKEYPDLEEEARKRFRHVDCNQLTISKKQVKIMKISLRLYSFLVMLKNTGKREV